MQKVKEEFFLSLIFVAKWLLLVLGTLGILYFAISRAYQTYYYDPLIKEYQVKSAEFNKEKTTAETTLKIKTSA